MSCPTTWVRCVVSCRRSSWRDSRQRCSTFTMTSSATRMKCSTTLSTDRVPTLLTTMPVQVGTDQQPRCNYHSRYRWHSNIFTDESEQQFHSHCWHMEMLGTLRVVSEMFKCFLACPGSVIASIVLVTKYARNEGERD